jgi:acyl-CoA thioester hydrolase
MISYTTQVRVRYADTDQMKFVYYGKYFEYFEQGRSDFLRSLGLPYGELELEGYYLPVIEAQAKYRRSAKYDDLLNVEVRLSEIPAARVRLEYVITRENEPEVLVEGFTVHSFLNIATGRPTRAPEEFVSVISRALAKKRA